ncbi:cilia- and flagella-associated protein 74 isoform X4 [Choloepus didactylus]|nr:cilia- and flagella-associated protein 74 isoform X4 [Choloepus didactylus]
MEEGTGLFPEQELGGISLLEDADELKSLESEVEGLALEAEEDAASGSCCPVEEADANTQASTKPTTATDRHQTLRLQRDLSYVDKVHEEKDLFIQKTRAELCASRQRVDFIIRQQENVAAEMAVAKAAGNTAAAGRLQAGYYRLRSELDSERQLESKITSVLQESENDMWHIEIEQGKLEAVRKFLQEEVAATGQHLQAQAAKQLCREKAVSRKVERSRLLRIRKAMHGQKELGLRHQQLVEDAQKNHRVAVRFLKASLGRIRERERKAETESREHLQRRMEAVLALKTDITANRETLRKFQAWGQARARLAEQKAQAEKEAILAQDGDAFKHLSHQRRRQELEAQRQAFEEEQKLRRLEIVARILKEEAEEENRKKKQPPAPKPPARLTLRDKTWGYISDLCEGAPAAVRSICPLEPEHPAHPTATRLVQAISSESVQGDPGAAVSPEGDTLAQPEIPGLWDEEERPHQAPREEAERERVGGAALDGALLARTTERPRHGLVRRQPASGHEFRGHPFSSKPGLLHFKDFDVGKVYKKKITLVNATCTINFCKLVGVEEHLRDFVRVDFNPPGLLSAGMSCDVLVTFKPMVNKDLEGSVSFLAQTGEFSVPLKCSTKKCCLSLDKKLIDFGSYVVGQTASRTVTLTNAGGLGTRFKFLPTSEAWEQEPSASVLKTGSFLIYEDKGLYEKVVPSLSDQQPEGTKSSLTDGQSQREPGKPGSRDLGEGLPAEPERTILTPVTEMPPCEEQTEITLGEITEGDIAPFASIRVPIIFTPVIPGEVQANFKVTFKNQQCPTLYFRATGVAIDVPVWVPKSNVDLKICMYDRLYQDSILVHSRSKAALRLKFEVCKELRGHMELLPQTGYVQAMSSYSVQLKFKPRHSLPEDAGKYFDKEGRVLEAPMAIWVADQVKPVGFTVHAIVTTSDLELSPSEVDFGHCTIYEAVRTQVTLRNHSLLPQEFGFVGLPKFVDIQPSDGFGTVQPLESLLLDVLFQPPKAGAYSFELVCKSEINRPPSALCRQFKVSCRAVGVHPPLELSQHQIKFRATALYDTSVATLYVVNSHISTNALTHSVPRIGAGGASPVGPTSFEFLLPPGAPLTISPSVGTLLPGKRCLVQVAFRPVLPEEEVCREALQALSREAENKFHKDTATQRRDLRRQSNPMRLPNRERLFRTSSSQDSELQRQELNASCNERQVAQAALARAFGGKFDKFVVPCVVATGDIKDEKETEPMSFSPHNTLYLELWCPAVAPSLVVLSDKGKTSFNFGDVAVGHRGLKKVSIQNICPEDLTVEFSLLNPNGPFVLLNPFSRLQAGEVQVLVLCFSPQESVRAQETLDVVSKRGTLTLTLVGTGLASTVTCSIEGGVLDMGYVIARESVSATFKLQNSSALPTKFSMRLDSLAPRRGRDQPLPQFLASRAPRTDSVGTQNYNGQSVFSVVPIEGVIDPGRAQDFTVTFSPDHESLYFSDRLQVLLFDKKVSHQILLKGAAREHMMFVEGGDPLDVPVESLTVTPALDPERREEAEELKPILVTLDYVQLDTDTPAPPATRKLQVGCIRTTQLSPKKTVEFSLDSTVALQQKGFSIEPSRGIVERGQTKAISISWTPTADFDPDHPLMASALLQLRGDVKETYKVLFVAQVVSGS